MVDGEIKRKLALVGVVLVLLSGILYQGGRKLGFWGQLGSEDAVTLVESKANTANGSKSSSGNTEGNGDKTTDNVTTGQVKSNREQPIVVHVVGAVAKPGVYSFPNGSRIYQAVEKAVATKEAALGFINLAEPLQDGEQIIIPSKADAAKAGSNVTGSRSAAAASLTKTGRTGSSSADSGLININTANQAQLDTLPGIGPAMAQRIIAYRATNGPFKSVQDLQKVSGIGTKKFNGLASRVRI